MHNHSAVFQTKEDAEEIHIKKDEVDEVIPDADARFSLITLINGKKYFVEGTENQVWEKLRDASDADGLDLNVIL